MRDDDKTFYRFERLFIRTVYIHGRLKMTSITRAFFIGAFKNRMSRFFS